MQIIYEEGKPGVHAVIEGCFRLWFSLHVLQKDVVERGSKDHLALAGRKVKIKGTKMIKGILKG